MNPVVAGMHRLRGGDKIMGRFRDGYGLPEKTHETRTIFTGQFLGRIWVKYNPSTAKSLGLEWEDGFDPKWDWDPYNPCGLNGHGQLCRGSAGITFKEDSLEAVEEEIAAFLRNLPSEAAELCDFAIAAEREHYDVRISD